MNTYITLKLLHLGALVLWLGPGIGAWIMLMVINRYFGEPSKMSHLAYRLFLRLMWIEHMALATLLATGLLLAWHTAQFDSAWLQIKLLIITSLLLPLEAIDIWFVHHRLPRMFTQRRGNTPYSSSEYRLLTLYHRRFTPLALTLLPVIVVSIMWLAIGKNI